MKKTLSIAAVLWIFSQPAVFAMSVEERLDALETEVKALRAENKELRKHLGMDAASPGPAVVKAAGKEPNLKIGGLVQAQADFGDKGDSRFSSDNDRFYLRRARLNASGSFLEEFDFKAELDLTGTLTETSALRAQMTDAYVNWNRYPEANLRAGQFKTPFGYEQLSRDPSLYTIERTLANDRLTLGRQIGAQVSGEFFEKRLTYAAGLFNGNGANNNFNDDDNFTYVGRLAGVPWQGKLWGMESSWGVGANAYASHDTSVTGLNDFGFTSNTLNGKRWGAGADTQLRVDRFDLWAEYLHGEYDPLNRVPSAEVEARGWYLQGSYFILPKKLQGVVKFDVFDPDTERSGTSTDTWTFGASYYIKGDELKLQFNYLLSDAAGESEEQDKFLVRLQSIF